MTAVMGGRAGMHQPLIAGSRSLLCSRHYTEGACTQHYPLLTLHLQAGFLTSVIEEFMTGRGTLQQIGLLTPNPALCTTLVIVFGGLTAYNAARTLYRATNKEMTAA